MITIIHGTQYSYNHGKCRCDACTKAQTIYMKRYRQGKHKVSNTEKIRLLEKRLKILEKVLK